MENRQVEIGEPITIQDGYILSYKLYTIRTFNKCEDKKETIINRRYSDFQYLHNQLTTKYGGFLIPKLPGKNILTAINMESPTYIKERK